MQGAQVQSLVRKLRSMQHDQKFLKNSNKKIKHT